MWRQAAIRALDWVLRLFCRVGTHSRPPLPMDMVVRWRCPTCGETLEGDAHMRRRRL